MITSRSMILDELKKTEAGDIVASSKLQYSQIPPILRVGISDNPVYVLWEWS
jgi:hypothetical protein